MVLVILLVVDIGVGFSMGFILGQQCNSNNLTPVSPRTAEHTAPPQGDNLFQSKYIYSYTFAHVHAYMEHQSGDCSIAINTHREWIIRALKKFRGQSRVVLHLGATL